MSIVKLRSLSPVLGGLRAVVLAALGCASHEVPRAPSYLDKAAKMSTPPPGEARLYVYREASILATDFTISVAVSGKHLGQMGSEDYLTTDLTPGHYVLSARLRSVTDGAVSPSGTDLQLELAGDRVYFVRVETGRAWRLNPPTLVLMDEAQGRQQMEKCHLVGPAYVRDRCEKPET